MTDAQGADDFTNTDFVDLGPARVCVRTAGSGPALVLLHGFPLSGLTWRHVVPALARQFTCYALDLIGLGDSTSSVAADHASPGQAVLFQRALKAQGVSSYALVGNDTGGWIARELALLDTPRVTHLVLTNTEIPGHRPPWIPLYQWLARVPGSPAVMRRLLASRWVRRSPMGFGGCFDDLDRIDGEFTDLFVAPLLASPARIARMCRFLVEMKFARLDCFRELHGRLSMPVAFVWGAADPTFPESTARAMAAQFPNVVGFRSVPQAKLLVQEEQPEALTQAVIEFVRNAAQARAGAP